MAAIQRGQARIGWALIALFLACLATAPFNPLLESRGALAGFLVLVIAAGIALTLYGVDQAWPPEQETLEGTDAADRERDEALRNGAE